MVPHGLEHASYVLVHGIRGAVASGLMQKVASFTEKWQCRRSRRTLGSFQGMHSAAAPLAAPSARELQVCVFDVLATIVWVIGACFAVPRAISVRAVTEKALSVTGLRREQLQNGALLNIFEPEQF
jgi:hypothetical protein